MQLRRLAKARLDQDGSSIRREIHETGAPRRLIQSQAFPHGNWNVGNVLRDKGPALDTTDLLGARRERGNDGKRDYGKDKTDALHLRFGSCQEMQHPQSSESRLRASTPRHN